MNLNEIWIVFEVAPGYTFTSMYLEEEKARDHVDMRLKSIKGTEMDGRNIFYKKYVVLE